MFRLGIILGLVLESVVSLAAVRVVTSTTELGWLAQEIGKQEVSVSALLTGKENPHYVDTIPDYVRQVADSQVVCVVGLDLEIGWMPKVLSKSGNAAVQPGGKGYCEAGKRVGVIEKPTGEVDRSMGDIHPSGNPHFWLSPKEMVRAADEVVATLSKVEPAKASQFEKNKKELVAKLDGLMKSERIKLKSLSDSPTPVVMEYHKEFAYLLDLYGLRSWGSLEEKPGVPPSAGRIAEVAMAAKQAGVRAMLAADYSPRKTLDKFTELSGIPVIRVSTSLLKNEQKDYLVWHAALVDKIAQAVPGKLQ